MLSDVCAVLLDLPASAIMETGPQNISSFAGSRNYLHPSTQCLMACLACAALSPICISATSPLPELWRCLTPSSAPHPSKHDGHSSRNSEAFINHSMIDKDKILQGASWDWAASTDPLSWRILSIHHSVSINLSRGLSKWPQGSWQQSTLLPPLVHCPLPTAFSTVLHKPATF